MTAITAADFYNAHKDQEHEYVFVEAAYAVNAGDRITVNPGIRIITTADEAGYLLNHSEKFVTAAELDAETVSAEGLELPIAKEDISSEELADIKPVVKGQDVIVNVGFNIQTTADHDGVLIKTESGNHYMSAFDLTETFNYARAPGWAEEYRLVMDKDAAPVKGVLLEEDVTFAFKAGDYEAKAGSILYINPDDEDGYTVQETGISPNTMLRISAEETAAKKSAAAADKNEDKLRNVAPKTKFKP